MKQVVVSGCFDDFRLPHVRLLDEASRLGPLHVLLWSDAVVRSIQGGAPKFPQDERFYIVQAMRHVSRVTIVNHLRGPDVLPSITGYRPDIWATDEVGATPARHAFCRDNGLSLHVISSKTIATIPHNTSHTPTGSGAQKRVVVTGCYDWFHSGHIRFFEEASGLGALYVVVGHDANIRLLKGDGHPLFPEAERRYVVGAVRYVEQALISSGTGWMDAEPEIEKIKPHIYAVNEDGDKPEKREFCRTHNIEYVVLKRTPKEGLPRRQSTDLRGF